MKNILLLVDVIQGLSGGAERQIFELSRNIDQNRYRLIVGSLFKKDALLKQIEGFGIQTVRFGIERIYGLCGLRQGFRFMRFLREEKIDILVTYHFGSDIWGTIFGKLAGVPVIISNRRDAGFWRKKIHIRLYRMLNRFVTKIIVVSEAVKSVIQKEEGIEDNKIRVLYNGIELDRFHRAIDIPAQKRKLGLPEKSTVIGCVGNIRAVKGHRYLIEATTEILRQFPDVHVIFIGGSEKRECHLKRELQNFTEELKIDDHIHFLGVRRDVPDILPIMDICVLPSLSEGLSNTLLEYMAMAKPIVASNAGGNPELIQDGRNGLMVRPGRSDELAEKIMILLRNPELCHRLSQGARKDVIERFSIAGMVDAYSQIFDELT